MDASVIVCFGPPSSVSMVALKRETSAFSLFEFSNNIKRCSAEGLVDSHKKRFIFSWSNEQNLNSASSPRLQHDFVSCPKYYTLLPRPFIINPAEPANSLMRRPLIGKTDSSQSQTDGRNNYPLDDIITYTAQTPFPLFDCIQLLISKPAPSSEF